MRPSGILNTSSYQRKEGHWVKNQLKNIRPETGILIRLLEYKQPSPTTLKSIARKKERKLISRADLVIKIDVWRKFWVS